MRPTLETMRRFFSARIAPVLREAAKAEARLFLTVVCTVVLAVPAALFLPFYRGAIDLDVRVYDCTPGLSAALARWADAQARAGIDASFAPAIDLPGREDAPATCRIHYVAANFDFLRLQVEGPPKPFLDHCRLHSYNPKVLNDDPGAFDAAAALAPFYAAIALLVLLRLRARGEALVAGGRVLAALRGVPAWSVAAGLATGVAAALVVHALQVDVAAVRDAGPLDQLFARAPGAALGIALVAAPLFEELLFRRWLYDGFLRAGMPWTGGVFVSVNFALLHVHWTPGCDFAVTLAVYAGISAMLCAVYARTRNVFACAAAHAAHNAAAIAIAAWWGT